MLNKIRLIQRNFGLIGATGFFIAAFAIAIMNWRGASLTISQHIASDVVSMVIFGFINTIATTLIAICLFNYIAKRWKLGRIFKFLAGTLTAGLYLIGWFPDQFDNFASSIIHKSAAFAVFTVAAIMVATLGTLLWNRTGWALKTAASAFVVAGLFGVVTASFFFEFFANNIFWVESFYMVAFYAFVLSMVYSKDRGKSWFKKHFQSFENLLSKLYRR
ncbi:hypothetical protein FWF93_00335 [Candidatus Saccharibacteria bacterium]|nr:hypothetical protein [Candidatus Saccharibacteria bacterium]